MEPRREFLTDKEAVAYLLERRVKTTVATMKNQRSYGKWGLKFYRLAGRIYYSADDLDEWLNHNRFAEGGRRCPRPLLAPAEAGAPHQPSTISSASIKDHGAGGAPANP